MTTASIPTTPQTATKRRLRSPFVEIGLLLAVALIAVLAAQCADETSSGTSSLAGPAGEIASGAAPLLSLDTEQIRQISLTGYDDCDALLDYLQGEAAELVGPYGLDYENLQSQSNQAASSVLEGAASGPPAEATVTTSPRWAASASSPAEADMADSAEAFAASPATPPRATASPADAPEFSGTNVQVEGVDEADIVKTDGRRIIGISNQNELWVADVTQAVPRLRGRTTLRDGDFLELYLDEDRVFVIGNSTVGINPPGSGGVFSSSSPAIDDRALSDMVIDDRASGNAFAVTAPTAEPRNAVVITEVNIDDLDNPRIMRHLRVEGRYISSRLADGFARVALSTPAEEISFVRPSRQSNLSESSARRFNQLLIRESTLDQWLPDYNLHAANGETISSGQLTDCDKVYSPNIFSGFNQVSVLTFATDNDLQLSDAVATLADGRMIYASNSNLYVSQTHNDLGWQDSGTVIHKFSLSDTGTADYEASGAVAGYPLSQYAFHEYDGTLFVATTNGERRQSESFVTALEDDGRALRQVGKVGNLGRGEDIYAVRYVGSKAYVVTFRQTDPLYVIDISDPTNPTTEGELKITGYSAYLHPVGEDLLLGVGREATDTGRVTGAKVSLFDVSDPSDPSTLDTLFIEDGSSEVEWDARAFLWWEPEELAVVPVSDWHSSGALALRVSTDAESAQIDQIARITHGFRGSNSREILRSIVIGDDLWTLSHGYLQANSLDTLTRRAWLNIPD